MIFGIILVIVVIAIIGSALFIIGPEILDTLLDAYDKWVDVIDDFRDRRSDR